MGNFSQPPDDVLSAALAKGYTGVRIEQGVPLLDRDLNLLGDLPGAMLRTLTETAIGDGTTDDPFKIQPTTPPSSDFLISGSGVMFVGGSQARIAATERYSQQSAEPIPPPPASGTRRDLVYLDVTEGEVSDTLELSNPDDVGQRTSVRQQTRWVVRVHAGASLPAAPGGHRYVVLASIDRAAGATALDNFRDERPRIEPLSSVAQRLRRLETNVGRTIETLSEQIHQLETRLSRPAVVPISAGSELAPELHCKSPTREVSRTLVVPGDARPVRNIFVMGHILAHDGTTVPQGYGRPFVGVAGNGGADQAGLLVFADGEHSVGLFDEGQLFLAAYSLRIGYAPIATLAVSGWDSASVEIRLRVSSGVNARARLRAWAIGI